MQVETEVKGHVVKPKGGGPGNEAIYSKIPTVSLLCQFHYTEKVQVLPA